MLSLIQNTTTRSSTTSPFHPERLNSSKAFSWILTMNMCEVIKPPLMKRKFLCTGSHDFPKFHHDLITTLVRSWWIRDASVTWLTNLKPNYQLACLCLIISPLQNKLWFQDKIFITKRETEISKDNSNKENISWSKLG